MGLFSNVFGGSDLVKFTKHIEKFSQIKVGDVMSKNVLTTTPDESLVDAANVMIGHQKSCLVAVGEDYQKPKGIITERDFLLRQPITSSQFEKLTVKDLMITNLVKVQPSLTLMEAQEIMDSHNFRKLVVEENGKLVGIITSTDLLEQLNIFYQKFPFKTSDSLFVKNVCKETKALGSDKTIADAQKKMIKESSGTCFVTKEDKLVGIFTEFDFLSNLADSAIAMKNKKLEEVMSWPIMAISGEFDLFDASYLMMHKGSRRMPVLQDGKIIGKITQKILRREAFKIIKKTLANARSNNLVKFNFEKVKPKPVNRLVRGKVQEFIYGEL